MRIVEKKYLILFVLIFFVPISVFAQNKDQLITIDKRDTLNAKGLSNLELRGMKGMKVSINGNNDTHSIIYKLEIVANKDAIERNFGKGKLSFIRNKDKGILGFNPDENISQSGNNMTWIKALLTSHRHEHNVIIKKASISMTIPADLQLLIQSKYSDISISTIKGSVTLNGKSGKIIANDLGSELKVENNFGNISLNNISGSVDINGKSATMNIQNIGGNVHTDANYSNININQVKGDVSIQDKSGTVHLSNISGSVTHGGNYSGLYLTNIQGKVNIETESGSVHATEIGSFQMTGDYTNVNIQSVKKSKEVTIRGKSAKYTLYNVKAPISVYATYAELDLKNIIGDVKVDDKSGNINGEKINGSFSGNGDYNQYHLDNYLGHDISIKNKSGNIFIRAQNQLHKVNISNQYADINMILTVPFKGKVHLKSISGSINTNLGLKTVSSNLSSNEKIMEGQLGNSSASINIDAQNGKITINQK